MRVMIAGGGTGGHVYPGIAMYQALERACGNVDVLFVGATAGVEARIFDELSLPHVLLPGRGLRRAGIAAKVTGPVLLSTGVVRAVREINRFKPDVIIGTGGYASVALVVAAALSRRPRVLQEQNSVPGMANRSLSNIANLVLLSYQESRRFISKRARCEVIGNPLRVAPVAGDRDNARREALAYFDLASDIPTVLVFGGSRGARTINNAAIRAIPALSAQRQVQFVVLTGEGDFERVKSELSVNDARVRVLPFLESIEHAYNVADIAVSRAGASAVFELAAFGIPTVFIPYPYAADDHQLKNVAALVHEDATVVVDDAALDGTSLAAVISSLLDDSARREKMSRQMMEWAPRNAADAAARHIVDMLALRVAEPRTTELVKG